jgi:hypothetical protein
MLHHLSHPVPPALIFCCFLLGQSPTPNAAPAQSPSGPTPVQAQEQKQESKAASQAPKRSVVTVNLDGSAPGPDLNAQPVPGLDKRSHIDDGTKTELVQLFNSDLVRSRKTLPMGVRDIVVTEDGRVRPGEARLHQLAESYGTAAKVGDLVRITNIVFKERTVYLEVNGGPKKKSKWYDHVSVGGAGGTYSPQSQDQSRATGVAMTLEFKRYVPTMNATELRQLLNPLFDFDLKTSAQVATESFPPKVQAAVKKHEVLVGMDRSMVVLAMERPELKVREKNEKGQEYEEWIYGKAPQQVVFVRFIGDEVIQVKTAKPGGEIVVKTEKEVEIKDGVAALASAKVVNAPPANEQPQQPARRPTLRRDDDPPDPSARTAPTLATPTHKEEPQWGEQPPSAQGQGQPPSNSPPPR